MSTIKTTMTADAQQLLAAQKQVAQGAANVSNEYRTLTQESARLSSVATRAFNETRTPLEKYNARLQDLGTLLRKGKLDQDTYNRAVEQAGDRYRAATDQGSKLSGIMTALAASAGGFLSVGAAIGAMTSALEAANEEAKKAAENVKMGFTGRSELAQVLDDMRTADEQISQFMRRGGAGADRNLAAQSVFEMHSAGLAGDMPTFLDVGRSGLVSAQAMPGVIGAIKSLQVAFTPEEAGGSKAILSKALAAGAVAKGSMQDVVEATSDAGADAHALGLSDEETMAAIAILSVPLGNVKTGGKHAAAMFRELGKSGFKGNLSEALDMMQKRLTAGDSMYKILGSENAEAAKAANLLVTNAPTFRELTAGVQAGNTGQALQAKLAMLQADPQSQAVATALAGEGTIDAARTGLGTRETLRASLVQQHGELTRLQGLGPINRWILNSMEDGWFSGLTSTTRDKDFTGQLVDQSYIAEELAKAIASGNTDLVNILKTIDETQKQLKEMIQTERSAQTRNNRDRSPAPRPTVPAPEN